MVLSCGKWQMKRRSGLQSATECRPRLNSFESPRRSSATFPMRAMIPMFRATYTESVISMPTFAKGEVLGPIT
jgi:hypothetical protein